MLDTSYTGTAPVWLTMHQRHSFVIIRLLKNPVVRCIEKLYPFKLLDQRFLSLRSFTND